MKYLLFLSFIVLSFSCQAQFFHKTPVPGASLKLGATAVSTVRNLIKPIIGITATVSNGASLGGGVGISLQHSKANAATNSWDIQYSISAIAFLTTNGNAIGGTGGIVIGVPGTGGLVQVGGGRDFTQKQWVVLTGVGIPIF